MNIKVKLNSNQYNAVFNVAASFTGEQSKIVGSKLMEYIKSIAVDGEKIKDEAEFEFEPKLLDGFFIGVTEIIKTDKTTTNDVLQLKEICSLLKMRNRFSKMVDEVVEKVAENKEEFDYDAGEFDA